MKTLVLALFAVCFASPALAGECSHRNCSFTNENSTRWTPAPARFGVQSPLGQATAILGQAVGSATRLVKFANEGLKLDQSGSRQVALLVGGGLGCRANLGRGLNWNLRLNLIW